MKILLIGGAGLLGTSLAPALELAGHDVFIADNFSGSMPYRTPTKYPIFSADATNTNALRYVFDKVRPDVVMLMVGHYYARDTIYSFYEESRVILSSANVVASLLKRGMKHVFYFSHSDVYGGPETTRPIHEDRKVILPATYRGASCLSAENLLRVRCAELNVPLSVVRLFEMVGPRIMFTPVSCRLNFIVDSLLRREQLGLRGLKRKYDFIHVDDVVSAVRGLLEVKFNGTVNVGSGEGLTLPTILKELGKLVRIYQPPMEVPDLSIPTYSAVADTSTLKEAVPWWEPKVDVIEYLPDLVEFRRKEEMYYRPENLPNVLNDQRRGS